MNGAASLGLALIGLSITLFSAVILRILRDLSWHEVTEYCKRYGLTTRIDSIRQQESRVLLGMETLELLSLLLAVWAASSWWKATTHSEWWFISILPLLGGAVVLLAAAVWIPQAVSQWWGVPVIVWSWPICAAVGRTLQPLAAGATVLTGLLGRLDGHVEKEVSRDEQEKALEDEIRTIVSEGIRDGLFENDTGDMIEGVMELDDRFVSAIMTPRSEMDTIDEQSDWESMLQQVIDLRRTRIPVMREAQDDTVRGVLYVKDLLPELAKDNPEDRIPWSHLIRDVNLVPKTTRVDEMLKIFLRERQHMAIVRDEFKNLIGLVTIEDALEEIVGEIVDESDREEPEDGIRPHDDHVVDVSGGLTVAEVNDRLQMNLPEDQEFDTVAGFVLKQLGRIPCNGESISWQGITITVVQADARRIIWLRFAAEDRPLRETA